MFNYSDQMLNGTYILENVADGWYSQAKKKIHLFDC